MKYFGGIEGGATRSCMLICDESGKMCGTSTGLGTNHWMIGIPETARRIADMTERAKKEAGIAPETCLTSFGLSLSGCEQEATNKELEKELRTVFPNLAENYVVSSDTMGSIYTASAIGGIVVIAGTGSNALLLNPDCTTHSCGGWGHFIGDEGSAWYIAHSAMKIVFDDMDNRKKSPFPIERAWELIKQHFNVETRFDLLPHCYANFDKSFFASLCVKLAKLAEEGDDLAKHLFTEAGQSIARSIVALSPKVDKQLVKTGDLSVVCVGSVWRSWHLMRDGFLTELNKQTLPFGLTLVRITRSMAYGACYMGADNIKFPLPRNYSENYEVMYEYKSNAAATPLKAQTNGNATASTTSTSNGIGTTKSNGIANKCDCD